VAPDIVAGEVMSTLRWTSICIGALALFSLMEKFINFGLAPHLNTVLSIYRGALYPIGQKLFDIVKSLVMPYHVNLPVLPLDAVILYVLFCIAVANFIYNKQDTVKKQFGAIPAAVILAPFALLWPAIVAGNILALCLVPKLGNSHILFGWDNELAKGLGVCIALFGANAYLLA
jgi:hypothetical protein